MSKTTAFRETNQNHKYNISALKHIIPYLHPYKLKIFGMFVALLFTSSAILLMSKSLQYVIDFGFAKQDVALLNTTLIYFCIVVFILALATAIRYSLITMVGELVIADVKRDIYRKILSLSMDFFESTKSGEILARLTTDTILIQTVVGSTLSVAMRNIVIFFGSVVILMLSNFKLTIMIFSIIPLVIIPIKIFSRKMRKYSRVAQDKLAEITAHAEETIYAMKTIQSYARENLEIHSFERKIKSCVNTASNRVKTRAILTFFIIALIFSAIGFILWIGGHDVLSGKLSSGELSSFIFLSIMTATSVSALTEATSEVQKAAGAATRIIEFLMLEPSICNQPQAIYLSYDETAKIDFKNVVFFYPSKPEKPTLDNISLTFDDGKITALVGESGAGKSTIFQILLRFYNIRDGAILYNGIDIKNIDIKTLRSQFAYVTQDPIIFSSTVRENILYGDPKASFSDIKRVAEQGAALEFIEKLPNGFDTFLGEKGVRISGGQKQRIAIARALLKNPKVLLLDEATSSLDHYNEQKVQKSLELLMHNRTTIVIAHRLSTVVNADKIIVIKNGQVSGYGRHLELVENNQEYNKLLSGLQYQ